jgi:curved DNA-binding protein CbpA
MCVAHALTCARAPARPGRRALRAAARRAVARDASVEDIKRAYRTLAQAVHPDKHPTAALREVRACTRRGARVSALPTFVREARRGGTARTRLTPARLRQVATVHFNRVHEAYEVLRRAPRRAAAAALRSATRAFENPRKRPRVLFRFRAPRSC